MLGAVAMARHLCYQLQLSGMTPGISIESSANA